MSECLPLLLGTLKQMNCLEEQLLGEVFKPFEEMYMTSQWKSQREKREVWKENRIYCQRKGIERKPKVTICVVFLAMYM